MSAPIEKQAERCDCKLWSDATPLPGSPDPAPADLPRWGVAPVGCEQGLVHWVFKRTSGVSFLLTVQTPVLRRNKKPTCQPATSPHCFLLLIKEGYGPGPTVNSVLLSGRGPTPLWIHHVNLYVGLKD
ncbi:unnamed protein product [Pleuronectes platessa]|uniref:Uncharacterized protein n=1 Tax=Pleuronectes platessa TaxID=8262 RepID=A0A9N7YPM2_PLEPL|nr:unnamed protein product [Pleuronectes platessa]